MTTMDDLSAALAGSFKVNADYENNPAASHPRFSQYKIKHSNSNQEERRKQQLDRQKGKRRDYMNHVRRLAEGFNDGEDLSDEEEEDASMDTTTTKQKRKQDKFYAKQLMLSEWLVEVPDDFECEWMSLPCPVGKRCLIVATRGTTTSYNKGGYFLHRFSSHLPSGNRQNGYKSREHTVLDCVYCELQRTYFILDVMCWKGNPVYDSETEFRWFWLQSQINELDGDLTQISKHNPYQFIILPHFGCDKTSLNTMMETPAQVPLDGILFYHKRTHYTLGPTPLVLWLKAYMIPEILGVTVPSSLMSLAPSSYTGFTNHLSIVRNDRQWTEEKAQRQEKQKLTQSDEIKMASNGGGESEECQGDSDHGNHINNQQLGFMLQPSILLNGGQSTFGDSQPSDAATNR